MLKRKLVRSGKFGRQVWRGGLATITEEWAGLNSIGVIRIQDVLRFGIVQRNSQSSVDRSTFREVLGSEIVKRRTYDSEELWTLWKIARKSLDQRTSIEDNSPWHDYSDMLGYWWIDNTALRRENRSHASRYWLMGVFECAELKSDAAESSEMLDDLRGYQLHNFPLFGCYSYRKVDAEHSQMETSRPKMLPKTTVFAKKPHVAAVFLNHEDFFHYSDDSEKPTMRSINIFLNSWYISVSKTSFNVLTPSRKSPK